MKRIGAPLAASGRFDARTRFGARETPAASSADAAGDARFGQSQRPAVHLQTPHAALHARVGRTDTLLLGARLTSRFDAAQEDVSAKFNVFHSFTTSAAAGNSSVDGAPVDGQRQRSGAELNVQLVPLAVVDGRLAEHVDDSVARVQGEADVTFDQFNGDEIGARWRAAAVQQDALAGQRLEGQLDGRSLFGQAARQRHVRVRVQQSDLLVGRGVELAAAVPCHAVRFRLLLKKLQPIEFQICIISIFNIF